MMHSDESLAAEAERLRGRPGAGSAPPVLARFTVVTDGDSAAYLARLRAVLAAAVRLGRTADFAADSVPVDGVPEWFAGVSAPGADAGRVPGVAWAGRGRYLDGAAGRQPWEVQNWLFRFDPDEDSRGWQWWDATVVGPDAVHLWVDSWGESFFGCEELRWAAYTAGAARVEGPGIRRAEEWAAEAAGAAEGTYGGG